MNRNAFHFNLNLIPRKQKRHIVRAGEDPYSLIFNASAFMPQDTSPSSFIEYKESTLRLSRNKTRKLSEVLMPKQSHFTPNKKVRDIPRTYSIDLNSSLLQDPVKKRIFEIFKDVRLAYKARLNMPILINYLVMEMFEKKLSDYEKGILPENVKT